MTPEQFKQWQLQHYADRLSQAKSTEERAFLRNELYHLKKTAS